jgi:CRISPR-associated protein Cmr4
MAAYVFKLECLTDLHVGNGEANYSIIDNEVQKDSVLTDVPVIHASGLKGALKQHFKQVWNCDNKDTRIKEIFGNEEKDGAGQYKFFTALCLARPLRVTDGSTPYVLATSQAVLEHFSMLLQGLGCAEFYSYPKDKEKTLKSDDLIEVEGEMRNFHNNEKLKLIIGNNCIVLDTLSDYDLPVRARNQLDEKSGLSKNLWYEEIVPHKSIFYFVVITPDNECKLKFKDDLPVQIGGNASIGNGYCTIKEVWSNGQTQS